MKNTFESHIKLDLGKLRDKVVYVALSGGVDSMVLLHLCQAANLKPHALHCNFKLRGEDSDLDEEFVKTYCKNNNIEFESIQFETSKIAKRNKETIQVCARNLRYDWFDKFIVQNKQAVLLTAHHANDSIETFFINLLRGTSITGLSGITSEREQIYRPLLAFKKTEIRNYASKHNIPFREDKSNTNLKYTRNKIRHDLLPLMENMTNNLEGKMLALMTDLKGIDSFLTSQIIELRQTLIETGNNEDKIEVEKLSKLEQPILLRLFKNYKVQRSQISEIEKLLGSKVGAIFKNDSFIFLRDRDHILIKKVTEIVDINEVIDKIPSEKKIGNITFKFSEVSKKEMSFESNSAFIDYSLIKEPLVVTNNHLGLRMQPLGMKGTKLISDILTDAKLNRFEKEKQYVLLHGAEVIWIAGKTISQKYAISNTTKRILKIEILE